MSESHRDPFHCIHVFCEQCAKARSTDQVLLPDHTTLGLELLHRTGTDHLDLVVLEVQEVLLQTAATVLATAELLEDQASILHPPTATHHQEVGVGSRF